MPNRAQVDSIRPHYPVWIRSGRVRALWAAAVVALAATAITTYFWTPGVLLVLVSLPLVYTALVLTLAARQLSEQGGGVQARIHGLLVDAIGAEGRLLDIGCGSGELLVRLARSGSGELVGLDHWGDDWEYSRDQAVANAATEGVAGLHLVAGTASSLPFGDGEFARVVSCLTFHEVRDVADRTTCVAEALRVLAAGGRFAFFDLFDDPRAFGGRANVVAAIDAADGEVEIATPVTELIELAFPLNQAQSLKHAVLIVGTRR